MDAIVRAVQDHEARVNVTFSGHNGDLPDPVSFEATDGDVKQWVTEAVRTGGIPGVPAAPDANFTDFVVDRFPATEARPYKLLQLRPKTPFGFRADHAELKNTARADYTCRHCGYQVASMFKCLCQNHNVPQMCPACGCPSTAPLNE